MYIYVCTHIFAFFCSSIHYMCDSSVACITSVIILLVTRKNKYQFNALIKKAIDTTTTKCNSLFF